MASLHTRLAGIGLAAALVATAACSDFLAVDNPNAVDVDKLKDSTNAGLLVNGAIGEFQGMIGIAAMYGGVLSDESKSAHSNVSYGPIDLRTFTNLNDIDALVYSPLQRSRFIADTTADRLKGYFGTAASSDTRVARMLAFAGYSYMMLGETFCSAPINLSAPLAPAELFQRALARYDEAIAIATAAKGVAGASAGAIAAADSVLNLARVGAARTAMNLNDKTKAINYAKDVPASFQFRVLYSEGIPPQSGAPVNPYWNGMGSPELARSGFNTNQSGGINYSSGALWVVVDDPFVNLHDPRVPQTPTPVKALNNGNYYVANKPASFGGYVKDVTTKDSTDQLTPVGAPMTPGASIRIASGLEAQYIIAEANGGVGTTLAFVNTQRAANQQGVSTATTPAEILADLRDQKRREFYLDGHRLGEIRRYKAQYNLDFFPTGPGYGTNECFVLPPTETNANPNAKG